MRASMIWSASDRCQFGLSPHVKERRREPTHLPLLMSAVALRLDVGLKAEKGLEHLRPPSQDCNQVVRLEKACEIYIIAMYVSTYNVIAIIASMG